MLSYTRPIVVLFFAALMLNGTFASQADAKGGHGQRGGHGHRPKGHRHAHRPHGHRHSNTRHVVRGHRRGGVQAGYVGRRGYGSWYNYFYGTNGGTDRAFWYDWWTYYNRPANGYRGVLPVTGAVVVPANPLVLWVNVVARPPAAGTKLP
jgi:hypothetical protein